MNVSVGRSRRPTRRYNRLQISSIYTVIYNMNPGIRVNLLLIGCGPHAEYSYLPTLQALATTIPIQVCGVVELEGRQNEERLRRLFRSWQKSPTIITTPPFTDELRLPSFLAKQLNTFVEGSSIHGVIIATEPRAHMQYALWAASKGLHILMDKPISAYEHAITSIEQATKLERDQQLLMRARRADRAFLINTERRYRPDFRYVFGLVDQVAKKFGIPITSMQSMHADGQWRLPHEILTESYHGYNAGYGKISHGGYHIADIVSHAVLRSFASAKKSFDQVGVYTQTVKPRGLLLQQAQEDYRRTFGKAYDRLNPYTDEQLAALFAKFGEVDAASIVTLYSNKEPVTHLTMNMIHNSFSRRSSLLANADLYNGNGRVRHEHYNIEQGPYQNIQIHAYHADQERPTNLTNDTLLGGNEHFDIYVFRNSDLLGGKPLEVIRSRDLTLSKGYDPNQVLVEQAKGEVVRNFVDIILGCKKPQDSYSDLSTHGLTAKLVSLMYRSTIKRAEARTRVLPAPPTLRHVKTTHSPLHPHIRILGAARTGKSVLVDELRRLNPQMVTFAHTPTYVYEWLRTKGIGDVGHVLPEQIEIREQIFSHLNEHEAKVINDILPEQPIAAIRGRADTLITHAAFRGKPMPRSIYTLLPKGMRPDLLIVLTAPGKVINERLAGRQQPPTSMNSLEFHERCQEMYMELAALAEHHLPVLLFDTSNPERNPQQIAHIIQSVLPSILHSSKVQK